MSDRAVILLAEDEEDSVLLIRHAFERAHISNPLHVVWNGQEAIAYLMGTGRYSNRAEYPLPDLFLLDLKMPRVNGFEVLEWIKQQPSLAAMRVLVLTSSDQLRDVNQAYQLGANSFLVKPNDFEDFIQLSKLIQDFWLKRSSTPEVSRPPRTADDQDEASRTNNFDEKGS
jgi:CheY-like chemotaxis protein